MADAFTTPSIKDVTREIEFRIGDLVRIDKLSYGGSSSLIGATGIIYSVQSETSVILDMTTQSLVVEISDISPVTRQECINKKRDDRLEKIMKDVEDVNSIPEQELNSEMNELHNKIMHNQEEFRVFQQRLREIETLKRSTNRRVQREDYKIHTREAFRMLIESGRYMSIEAVADESCLTGKVLKAVTEDVIIHPCKYEDLPDINEDINLGRYTIYIKKKDIHIKGSRVIDGYCHPHISSIKPCFGTFTSRVYQSISEWDIPVLLLTLWDYLHTIDRYNWYVVIHAWLSDSDKRCNNCWELHADCTCDKCRVCGEFMNDCECNRCPASGDVIEGDMATYCMGMNGHDPCENAGITNDGDFDCCSY